MALATADATEGGVEEEDVMEGEEEDAEVGAGVVAEGDVGAEARATVSGAGLATGADEAAAGTRARDDTSGVTEVVIETGATAPTVADAGTDEGPETLGQPRSRPTVAAEDAAVTRGHRLQCLAHKTTSRRSPGMCGPWERCSSPTRTQAGTTRTSDREGERVERERGVLSACASQSAR